MFKRLVMVVVYAAAALCATAPTACATTARTGVIQTTIIVGGKPFFPIMLIDECDAAGAAHARALGLNMIINESCPGVSPAAQLGALTGRELGVLSIAARRTRGPRLAGWTYPDEPENNGWTPATLARTFPYARGNDDGLVSFVTTTSAFLHGGATTVRAFARLADVAGFDLYPLNHCQSNLASVYDAQRRFVEVVGTMPTFQWIETGALNPHYCGGFHMTAGQLTAETWLAVTGGARGIGFFTHTLAPSNEFDVAAPVARAIQHFANLAGAVRPGLVGTTIRSSSNSGAVKVLARTSGSRTYVFAVNSLTQPVPVQLAVPNLPDGTLQVFGEKRTVEVSNHRFSDLFRPLAVHVYVRAG
jgi:hypothetical protein